MIAYSAEMPAPVWLIGCAIPAALLLGTAVAFARRHRHRRAIAIAVLIACLAWLAGWLTIRRIVADESQTLAAVFLQMVLASVVGFVFAVAVMIAARVLQRPPR